MAIAGQAAQGIGRGQCLALLFVDSRPSVQVVQAAKAGPLACVDNPSRGGLAEALDLVQPEPQCQSATAVRFQC